MQSFSHRVTCLVVQMILTFSGLSMAQIASYNVIPITSPFDPPGVVLPNDINNHRAVAVTDQKSGRPHMGYVWTRSKSTPLPTLGGTCSSANGINDARHVVGSSCVAGDSTFHAFLYRNHQMTDIDTFGGVSSFANRLNGANHVTGAFTTADGVVHAFFWQKKKWTDLGFLGGSNTTAYGLSDSDTVTGQSDISNDPDPVFGIPHFHSITWSNGVLTDLGKIFGSDFGYSVGVDASGRIAGASDLAGDLSGHAYLWDHGTVTDLSPYDFVTAWSNDINSQGDIIGSWGSNDNDPADGPPVYTILCPCFGVVWHNGQPAFLDSLVDPRWHLLLGLWINDKGDIVALGQFNGGPFQRVLLKPIAAGAIATRRVPQNPLPIPYPSSPRGFRRSADGQITSIR
jgi:probable HAF family extracellular repeat protein